MELRCRDPAGHHLLVSCRHSGLHPLDEFQCKVYSRSGSGLVSSDRGQDGHCVSRADASSAGSEEFYRVYLVSRSQIESCSIDKTDTPLLNCDKPHRDVKFTFKFQEFSPNLWGLEFLKGRDYYITCSSDPPSTLQESPTRFPPKRPKPKAKDAPRIRNRTNSPGGSESGLFVWVFSGCVILLLVVVVLLVLLWRYNRRHCVTENQNQSASVSLNTLAVPKRDSISSDNNGSDRSDVVFPLRPSDSMVCRHYERVSTDYGPPVYIVQEITSQTPTNIYYKV
ncbi:hypothetical protein INR49_016308 [Caranx melampygus]|nr:hypothetical protein INR49_016308 [Caranx melampygus]